MHEVDSPLSTIQLLEQCNFLHYLIITLYVILLELTLVSKTANINPVLYTKLSYYEEQARFANHTLSCKQI